MPRRRDRRRRAGPARRARSASRARPERRRAPSERRPPAQAERRCGRPGSARIARRRPPASASASSQSSIGAGCRCSVESELEEDVGTLDTGRNLSRSSCSSIATARSPFPARRWKLAARMRRFRASAGSAGVSWAASSQSSAAAAGAPRAAACSAAGVELGGDRRVRAFGREREVAGPLLDVRDRAGERSVHGSALPEGARS